MLIQRTELISEIKKSIKNNPITAILGPRQCGKTTITKHLNIKAEYFDLENPVDEAKLANPVLLFNNSDNIIILDEIQRKPELLPILRVYADKKPLKLRFIILGSTSPELIRKSSETLAGRIHFINMSGFSVQEIGFNKINQLWLRGGFPKSLLAKNDEESITWRNDFITTFMEKDIIQFGYGIPSTTLRRFWQMLIHYHGQIWNASEIGNSMGLSHTTTRKYIDILSGVYMVRQLQPYFNNPNKRLIKSPKIYLRDSGIFHSFLNVSKFTGLLNHPKLGSSWEGFAIEQVLKTFGEKEAYFWGTYAGAELDLLLIKENNRYGFEFKCNDAPKLTKSMQIAINELKLTKLWVIYPGNEQYSLTDNCECIPLSHINNIKL